MITETRLPLRLFARGKVRDTYELDDSLLMVATDRLSAFDVVFREGIPLKGAVLTQLSAFWFKKTEGIVQNHLVASDFAEFPASLSAYERILRWRSMIVRRASPIRVECVVRGYLSGSGWKEYQRSGSVCGIVLPKGLKESSRLPEPIFTPSTKAEKGHDINITFDDVVRAIGKDDAEEIRELSLRIYETASRYAEKRGIIIADTKLEFGKLGDRTILIDELLTPDSSRFWPAAEYEPGRAQASFDKQYVRDYLEKLGWDKSPPPPPLPREVVENTTKKYVEAYERLTGEKFPVV